jgi:serine/threonine protein kinase
MAAARIPTHLWKRLAGPSTRAKPKVLWAAAAVLLYDEAVQDSEEKKNGETASRLSSPAPRSCVVFPLPTPWILVSPRTASCEQQFLPRLGGGLRRHRTIEQMEKTASKETLQSRYAVKWREALGEGSFGVVYPATDRKTGEIVAVKKISKELTDNAAFQREMDALMHLRQTGGHPNICGLRENFEEGDSYYLVMDLVTGGEMFDKLCEKGAYSEADAARLVREVCSALAYLHGIGIVHGDLKPENLMLSSPKDAEAVIKVVDFGCAQVNPVEAELFGRMGRPPSPPRKATGNTPAYSPPEVLANSMATQSGIQASSDMWALGVIVYIMLTGAHPFDLYGRATDEEIIEKIVSGKAPPLRNSEVTDHLSPDAIELIERMITWDPKKRATALELLEHPWVRGSTARTNKMEASHKKLAKYRKFRSRLEAKVFADMIALSDNVATDELARRASLIERAFHNLNPGAKGYLSASDLRSFGDEGDELEDLSLSSFQDLLAENMKNRYYPKGHTIYKEGEKGDVMYFINSGSVEVYTKDGFSEKIMKPGSFFGEGALLDQDGKHSTSVRCLTPVHAIEVSRDYFKKYLSSDANVKLSVREMNKTRKNQRLKSILLLQQSMEDRLYSKGDFLFKEGENSELMIMDEGAVDITVQGHKVVTVQPGELIGYRSFMFGRPTNVSAQCVSDSCRLHVPKPRDFHKLLKSQPVLEDSIREMCLRREFRKALCLATKKPFPRNEKELKEAFELIDLDKSGFLNLDEIKVMIEKLDPTYTEKEVQDILNSLDLDETGKVSWAEFKRIFGVIDAMA